MAPKRKATTPAAKGENGEVAVPKKRGRPPRAKTSDPAPVAAPSSLAPVAAPGPPQAAASQKKKPAKKKAAPKAGKKAASSKKKAAPVKQISTEDDEEEDKENGEVPPATVDEADSGKHTKAAQIKSVTIEHWWVIKRLPSSSKYHKLHPTYNLFVVLWSFLSTDPFSVCFYYGFGPGTLNFIMSTSCHVNFPCSGPLPQQKVLVLLEVAQMANQEHHATPAYERLCLCLLFDIWPAIIPWHHQKNC
jgi:hypothetical protein